MPSLEARLSSNILQGSILPWWGKEPQSWAPLPHSRQTEGNPDFDILWSIFLFLNSSLSKDRFTAAWILRILWRAVMPLFLMRTAKRRSRGSTAPVLLLSAFPLNLRKALTAIADASRTNWGNEDRGKWESENVYCCWAPHCPFAMAPQVPHKSAAVNLLFFETT